MNYSGLVINENVYGSFSFDPKISLALVPIVTVYFVLDFND